MRSTHITLIAACAFLALFAQFGCAPATCETCPSKDGVLIHLSSSPDDAHALLMGLRMAQLMADSHPVLVYVDVHAIPIVLKDAPALNMQPFGSSRVIVEDLLARGVPIHACPGCLTALGKSPSHLMPGVKVAEKESFFSFAPGRILTLDY